MNVPSMSPRSLAEAIKANKQFVSFFTVVLLVMTAFPGSPGQRFITELTNNSAETPTTTASSAPAFDADDPVVEGAVPPLTPAPSSLPSDPGDPVELPPAEELPPDAPCSTDQLAAINDQLRENLATAVNTPLPGSSLNSLAEIAAGCSDEEPSTAVLDVALDIAGVLPDLGLPFIDVPDLPAIPPLPADAIAPLLAPIKDPMKQGCSQLATVALVLVVAPPAFQVPISQSDIIQFLAPASAFCALFDDPAAG